MNNIDKILLEMILLRVLSAFVELSTAFLMFHYKSIENAIKINTLPALVGPLVFIIVSLIGLEGLSSELNLNKLILILSGILLILLGTH
jgi:hypothetical protein